MQRLIQLTSSALLALCIVGTGCGDDDKDRDGPDDVADGGPVDPGNLDGGGNGGMDGSFTPRDGATPVNPDGALPDDAGGNTTPDGPDGSSTAPCGGSCDDKVDCTIDRCVEDKCVHAIDESVCTAGSSCSPTAGCQQGKACAMTSDCADDDGCTTNERCNTALARCEFDVLDRDGDGYAPVSCGGTDCNDAKGLVGPGASETCDAEDDDCDGVVDDGASCPAGKSCSAGACACTTGLTQCGGGQADACFDLKTNPLHCGACNEGCGSGGACTDGACSCPAATGTVCGDNCTDIKASANNCGGCGMTCPGIVAGGQVQSCLNGACTACGREDQPCCRQTGCNPTGLTALSCQGTQGAADSKCVCAAPAIKCDGVCTNITNDELNCGGCGQACTGIQVCLPKGETSSCVACGRVGEPCCEPGGVKLCRGGAICGPNVTCVLGNVPIQGAQ